MQSKLNPYISFENNTRQAMEFYKDVFGGKLTMTTFREFHAGESDLIMHSVLEADNGITFMASDPPPGMEHDPGTSIRMSLSGDNEEELRGYWQKLSGGAAIELPLETAPWGDAFGMLTDKFGIQWMVNITGPKS
jgi:PhnB protein